MTSAFFLLQYVHLTLELCVRVDASRCSQYLSSFDFVSLYASQQRSDVVARLCLVQNLTEHLYACDDYLSLLIRQSDDFHLVSDLQHASLDSSGRYGSASGDGEYVLYRHQERLVVISLRLRNVAVYCFHQLDDLVSPLSGRIFQRFQRGSSDDRCVVAREVVLAQQLSDFHLYQVQQLLIVDHVTFVQEYDDVRNAYLSRQQDVLSGLRHRSVRCSDDQDRSVHLSSSGDHVLYVVRVSRAVYVRVVSVRGLIFNVCGGDGDSSFLLFRCFVNLVELYVLTQAVSLMQYLGDRSRQSSFSVVYMADGSDIDMRLGSLIFLFCHFLTPFT